MQHVVGTNVCPWNVTSCRCNMSQPRYFVKGGKITAYRNILTGLMSPLHVLATWGQPALFAMSYMVSWENKKTNKRTMLPTLRNNAAAGYQGPVKIELLKCAGLLATQALVCPELYTTGARCPKGFSVNQAFLNMTSPISFKWAH